MTSKLVSEAIRVFSYGLARELLERTIAALAASDDCEDEHRAAKLQETPHWAHRIQKEALEEETLAKEEPANVEAPDRTALLTQQLAEKEALIQELRFQLESLQQQMTSLQRVSVPAPVPVPQPVRRRLRSLHQAQEDAPKSDEEDANCCSDKALLLKKSSPESAKSNKADVVKEEHALPDEKTPSLRDLQVIPVEAPAEKKEEQPQGAKPNIFNVEYEEFSNQLKLDLLPSTPSAAHPVDDFASPDFRRDHKPVMNWSNLPSPRNTSLQPDSLALKEAEKLSATSIWAESKAKAKPPRTARPKKSDLAINLESKARAKSQTHTSKQKKEKPAEIRKPSRENERRSAGTGKGRVSTAGPKGNSPKSAETAPALLNMTTVHFPNSHKEMRASNSFRQRKFSSKSQISEEVSPAPRKALDELLFSEEDSTNWQNVIKKMKESPSFLSRLLNEGLVEKQQLDRERREQGKEHKLVFTKVASGQKPVRAMIPPIDNWGPEVSGRDLNSVVEEDEDSSRSHFDPLPELVSTKQSFRNEEYAQGPLLKPAHRQPSSAPKPRPVQVVDWSESSLDSFVLGGAMAFNWDHRHSVFTEREVDIAYLRLHGTQLDQGELRSLFTKAKQTATRLMDELMLREDGNLPSQVSVEGTIGVLKQVKKMLAFRKATMRILDLIHQREDQLLTLMSLDDGSAEVSRLSQSVCSINSEVLSRISQWKAMGFPFKTFRYLNMDYAQKVEEEAASDFSMKHFGFR